jgi:hypothetical protein
MLFRKEFSCYSFSNQTNDFSMRVWITEHEKPKAVMEIKTEWKILTTPTSQRRYSILRKRKCIRKIWASKKNNSLKITVKILTTSRNARRCSGRLSNNPGQRLTLTTLSLSARIHGRIDKRTDHKKHHLLIVVAKHHPQNGPKENSTCFCRCQSTAPERTKNKTPPLPSNVSSDQTNTTLA